MNPEMHAFLGLAVLLVNLAMGIWAAIASRRALALPGAFRAGLGLAFVLLLLQILVGLDFWFRGARPAAGLLAAVHALGPIIALAVFTVMLLGRSLGSPARRYAVATHLTTLVALASYAIGEMAAA